MTEYRFRARCGICNRSSEWFETADEARDWRAAHFDADHPDNPMASENCAVQRYPADDVLATDGGGETSETMPDERFREQCIYGLCDESFDTRAGVDNWIEVTKFDTELTEWHYCSRECLINHQMGISNAE